MPHEIDLGQPPAGYTLTFARPDENVVVQVQDFASTEDGQHFVQLLEGLPSEILGKISPTVIPSQVDHLLAIIRNDGTATVYLNELQLRYRARAAGPVEAGAALLKDDIVDIDQLEFGVDVPDDAGVLFLFSVNWRKGLYYDFGPLHAEASPRQIDLLRALGSAFCHVMFTERFSISDDEWIALFNAKWFPFIGLRHSMIDQMMGHIRAGWNPDEHIPAIVEDVIQRLPKMLDGWRSHPAFANHFGIIERAVERFRDEDYISCTVLLFTRIEGILRTYHASVAAAHSPNQRNLANSAVVARTANEKCLLLPHRFSAYLNEVYFANCDPADSYIEVSRNSVGHGVAAVDSFNEKSAVIGLLVLRQLFYCFDRLA